MLGDVEEALAVLMMIILVSRLGDLAWCIVMGRLTRRSSHFSSSVTHLVSPGASSMWYISEGSSSTWLSSLVSTKRALIAGIRSAATEALVNFILEFWCRCFVEVWKVRRREPPGTCGTLARAGGAVADYEHMPQWRKRPQTGS